MENFTGMFAPRPMYEDNYVNHAAPYRAPMHPDWQTFNSFHNQYSSDPYSFNHFQPASNAFPTMATPPYYNDSEYSDWSLPSTSYVTPPASTWYPSPLPSFGIPQPSPINAFFPDRGFRVSPYDDTQGEWSNAQSFGLSAAPPIVEHDIAFTDWANSMSDASDPPPGVESDTAHSSSSSGAWMFGFPNATPCSGATASAYPRVSSAQPLKRKVEFEADDDLAERQAKRLRLSSAREQTGSRRTAGSQTKRTKGSPNPTHIAQLSPPVFQGDGGETQHRRQVEKRLPRTHVLEAPKRISGAGEQAGVSDSKARVRKTKQRERKFLKAAIGKPAPDCSPLTNGLWTVDQVRDYLTKRQTCLHSHGGEEPCGKRFETGAANKRENHCWKQHKCCCPEHYLEPGTTLSCPHPACRVEVGWGELDEHTKQTDHLLGDARHLRLVCPAADCPVGMIHSVPISQWFREDLRKHSNLCSWKGEKFLWDVVDEEPNLDDYAV